MNAVIYAATSAAMWAEMCATMAATVHDMIPTAMSIGMHAVMRFATYNVMRVGMRATISLRDSPRYVR
jgi:hypothetical protein